jgi:transposase-like protein/IS1 family transposase
VERAPTVAGPLQLLADQGLATERASVACLVAFTACPGTNAALGNGNTMPTLSAPVRCPNSSCPSSSHLEPTPGRLVRHSLLRTQPGTRQRWRCKECGRTFTRRLGTPYHRLRKPPSRFDRVIHMSLEGASKASNARVNEVSASTVSRWMNRAANYTQRFQERVLREVEPRELQADEVRGYPENKERRQFVFAALEVWARLWIGQRIGGRTKRNCRLLMREARARCRIVPDRVLIVTDPFQYYAPEIRKTRGPTCVHVESGKIIRGNKILRVRNRLVHGAPWQLQWAMSRSEDSRKPNTAFIERLNLFIRRSLASLHRRTNSAAKARQALEQAITLLQCYYNFVRPHGALRFGRVCRTPAQRAGLVTRKLNWRDIFLAFRPMARVPWIKRPEVRREWRTPWACPTSNS